MPTSEVQQGVIKINQCVNNDASREVFDAPETTSDAAGEVADATKQVVAEINEKRTRKDDESQDNKNQKRTKTIPSQLDLNKECAADATREPDHSYQTIKAELTPVKMDENTTKGKKITLALDLDETLIKSKTEDADFTILDYHNRIHYNVKKRPDLDMFLERVAEMFEVVVFTASDRSYADKIIDKLDPFRKLISRRFYRGSCTFLSQNNYIKDLTVLGVDMARVMIVDDNPKAFRLQVNNGIAIKPWRNDPSDRELVKLLKFLETTVNIEDVRPFCSMMFLFYLATIAIR